MYHPGIILADVNCHVVTVLTFSAFAVAFSVLPGFSSVSEFRVLFRRPADASAAYCRIGGYPKGLTSLHLLQTLSEGKKVLLNCLNLSEFASLPCISLTK